MTQAKIGNENTRIPTLVLTGPFSEAQLIMIAQEIQEVHDNRNIGKFLEEMWGGADEIDSFLLYATASMGEEGISATKVFDAQGKLRMPDLALPFWKEQLSSEDSQLKAELEECESDEARLEVLNRFLFRGGMFQEYGLPDPKSEHPAFQRRVLLRSLPVTYPTLFEGRVKQSGRLYQSKHCIFPRHSANC